MLAPETATVTTQEEQPPQLNNRPNHTGESSLKLKEISLRILARWPWIVLFLALGVSFGFYKVWSTVPMYQSKASVRVKDRADPTIGADSAININSIFALSTVRDSFYRYDLCEKVAMDPKVRRLRNLYIPPKPRLLDKILGKEQLDKGAQREAPPANVLAGMIRSWMSAKERKDSRIIDITIKHSSPEVAAIVANSIVSTYIDSRSSQLQKEQKDEVYYMESQATKTADELEKATTILSSYATPLEAEEELGLAEADLQTLSYRYKSKHPKYMDAKGRVDKARNKFRSALRRAINNASDDKNTYWKDYQEALEGNGTENDIEELRDRLISRKAILETEIQTKTKQFEHILERSNAGEMLSETAEAEVIMNDYAKLPPAPYEPDKKRIISRFTMLGLFLGIAVAYLFYRIDNKLHTVADVERTFKIPVLAAIEQMDPEVTEELVQDAGDEDNAWVSERQNWAPSLVFRDGLTNSHYTEMFRVLRTALTLLGPIKTRKLTLVTSSLPSEGKTLVACNLATSLAQQGHRVLLVDMDLRKPRVHEMYGRERDAQPGLVEFLAALNPLEECVYTNSGQSDLTLMLAGHRSPNPGELLDSYKLTEMLNKLRSEYDHIVLDTAPLLAVPDTRVIAPVVNNLLLVVRALRTPRGAVERALRLLSDSDLKPHGIVFNGYVESRIRVGDNYTYGYYGTSKKGRLKYGSYGEVYGEKSSK